jgi:hypothetical protein
MLQSQDSGQDEAKLPCRLPFPKPIIAQRTPVGAPRPTAADAHPRPLRL